ncbi:MAG: TolC family protein [Bacteroidales bacterium]|nr:TolC family protein [Bacteroidales bacterium]
MKIKVILVFLLFTLALKGQTDSIDLEKCRALTIERYPLTSDIDKNLETSQLKIQNIKTIYYPSLNLTGQYIHLADVPHLAVENPLFTIPVVGKDQYKIMLEARQIIYDGGLSKRMKELETANLSVENQDVKVKLYGLNNQVNDVYFMILLFQEQEKLLKLTRYNLHEQLKVVESGVRNGVLLPGDADVVKAEILKLDQKTAELHAGRSSGIEILSELMDSVLNEDITLIMPEIGPLNSEEKIIRPEYELLQYQSEKLDKANRLNTAYRFPYLGLFGQFGYGYPGQNMLEDKANIIYTFGVNLSWNIWDWGKVKREKQINHVIQDKISTQREVFDKNLRIAINKESSNISKLDKTIESDKEIIALRERITKAKESQLQNGVITSSEYIVELNAETQAKINMQLHEIQRLQATVNRSTLAGNIVANQHNE